ncbi:hypothetical protein [Sulfuricurvum sp.]|uniref:hypothetical protein n=1 Tax=Sulfuricurvum sp. TaxID=2025608 RepID=UPI003BB03D11
MKKYLLLGCISFISLSAAVMPVTANNVPTSQEDKELAWVDEQIQAILPARVGIPEGFINSLRDPMKMKKPTPVASSGSKLLAPPKLGSMLQPKAIEEPLRLLGIMNKTVLISGKWYKVGDKIRNFTLSEVKQNSVLLTGKKDQKLILFLTKQNNNIKITTK